MSFFVFLNFVKKQIIDRTIPAPFYFPIGCVLYFVDIYTGKQGNICIPLIIQHLWICDRITIYKFSFHYYFDSTINLDLLLSRLFFLVIEKELCDLPTCFHPILCVPMVNHCTIIGKSLVHFAIYLDFQWNQKIDRHSYFLISLL
jgi:hypothetical protein